MEMDKPYFADDCGVWERTVEKISGQTDVPFQFWGNPEWAAANMYYRRAKHKYASDVPILSLHEDGTPIPATANRKFS